MKLTFTHQVNGVLKFVAPALLMLFAGKLAAQTYPFTLGSPSKFIYGLTGNGAIYEVDAVTGGGNIIKNTTYAGKSPSQPNGLAYSPTNNKFYYFKRNPGVSNPEFVSFDPSTGTVSTLATPNFSITTHTGCMNATATGYYTIDVNGNLYFYNIAADTWTTITSSFIDQDGNNVSSIIQTQNSGDMAMDGYGNIWLVTSSSSNYGIYKISAPIPATNVSQIVVQRYMDPTTATPNNNSFQGIAFDVNGDIYLASSDNKLYRQQTVSGASLQFIANMSPNGMSNDLTSQNYPSAVLAVKWLNFSATLQSNNTVSLNWQVAEENNRGFYVECSYDGSTWQSVTFIPSTSNNKPASVETYSYNYSNKINGKIYFRIKQVDTDGAFTYSAVKTVSLTNDKKRYAVWPNPTSDLVHISGESGSTNTSVTTVQLFDQSGKMVASQQLQAGINTINIGKFTSGIYIARIQTGQDIACLQKIIKQ